MDKGFFQLITIFMVMMTTLPGQASAQSIEIGNRFCVLADEGNLTAQEAYAKRDQFDCSTTAFERSANHIWMIADISDAAAAFDDPTLKLSTAFSSAITIAQNQADGSLVSRTYSPAELSGMSHVPDAMTFPLAYTADQPSRILLIGIADVWDILNWTDTELVGGAAAQKEHISNIVLYALLSGLLMVPLVLCCVIYPVLRHRFLLFHFGMLSCALIYGVSWSEILNVLGVVIEPITRSKINHISIVFALMFGCYFTRELCGRDTIGRFWSKALPIAGIVPVIVAFILLGAAPRFSLIGPSIFYVLCALPLFAVTGALLAGSLKGIRICQLQLLAWSPMVVYVTLRIAHGLGLLDDATSFGIGLYPSLINEAVLTTSVVVYQIFNLRQERDHALDQKLVFQNLAQNDDLTGAMNRRTFVEHFEQVAKSGLTKSKTLYLLVIDIDHFKRVNDQHGHLIGDDVLVRLTKILKAHCRGEDACARFGGEEFCLLIAASSPASADRCANRLLMAVSNHAFPTVGSITVSIGVVRISDSLKTPFDSWFKAADKALYAAKENGRNRVQRSAWMPPSIHSPKAAYAKAWKLKKAN